MEDKGIYAMDVAGRRPAGGFGCLQCGAGVVVGDRRRRQGEAHGGASDRRRHVQWLGRPHAVREEWALQPNRLPPWLGLAHDNALIVAGLRRCGCDAAAARVCSGILDAAGHYPMYRLPELFAGLLRKAFGLPVHYPVACHPQAWAAGATPYMLTVLLGLTPEGLDGRLRVVRPRLPDGCDHVELRGLRIGEVRVDLRFTGAKSRRRSASRC